MSHKTLYDKRRANEKSNPWRQPNSYEPIWASCFCGRKKDKSNDRRQKGEKASEVDSLVKEQPTAVADHGHNSGTLVSLTKLALAIDNDTGYQRSGSHWESTLEPSAITTVGEC